MELATILIIAALVLLCPISMFWMARRHRQKMDGTEVAGRDHANQPGGSPSGTAGGPDK